MKQPMIILTGPTAVGKTALSIRLAKEVGGEIVSADSMQVYRNMDIGTAKIKREEMCGVPHHLIDVLEPTEDFNVARFQDMAGEAVRQIYSRGHIPLVVGGTGFYIQALLYGIDFTGTREAGDGVYRQTLEALAAREGPEYLYSLLREVDPEYAAENHPNNVKRVIRGLEYYHLTGEKFSVHNAREQKRESPYNFAYFVLTMDREALYDRINRRIDQMLADGLCDEVRFLAEHGVCRGMTSMQGLGYKEILGWLEGKMPLDEAVLLLKQNTRHFAKRQLTWFRRERDVIWTEWERFGTQDDILRFMLDQLRQKGIYAG